MKNLEADMILGMKVSKTSRGMTLSLSHSFENMLKKFNYYDCKIVSTLYDFRGIEEK